MNEKQFYEIRLEDYSFPRYSSAIKSYYGTREDIDRLIAHLKDDDNLRVRYSETIEAVESYDGTNVPVHSVAGQIFPILTPVEEVCRFETQLADQNWTYVNQQDEVYPCKASTVEVCQNLIRTENGYERCLKVKTFGICISYQGYGWVCPNGVIKGFPGTVTFHDNFRHSMNLFVSQAHYSVDEFAQAMADMVNTDRIDLTAIAADIVGGW